MQLLAWQAGILSGLGFALVATALALALRRRPLLQRPPARLAAVTLLASLALLVPPPLVLVARGGLLEIVEGGHAGANFFVPYLGTCAVALIAVAALLRPGRSGRHVP